MIRVETMFCKWLAAVCAICLMPFVPNANAQSSGGGGGQTSAPSTPSPGSGVTNGTAPIETTLFAYRALASDAAAVSHELAPLAAGSEVVIGTPADVAAFTQWRSVIGQIRVLANKANVMHTQLTGLAGYTAALPLPALSITKTHSGNF